MIGSWRLTAIILSLGRFNFVEGMNPQVAKTDYKVWQTEAFLGNTIIQGA